MSRLPVQYYLDKIGIQEDIPPKLYSLGVLDVLPIGKKRLAQLTAELASAYPKLTPTADQCWIYQIVLQLAQQEINYNNLCNPRIGKIDPELEKFLEHRDYREYLYAVDTANYQLYAEKRKNNATIRQTFPSLIDSMRPLTAKQTHRALQQFADLLPQPEITILTRIYRDHITQKAVAKELHLPIPDTRQHMRTAFQILQRSWCAPRWIFTIDPQLSVAKPINALQP